MSNYTQDSDSSINLTPAELERVEAEIALELQALGSPPTLDDLRTPLGPPPTIQSLREAGHSESATLLSVIDFISGLGRILTLLTAELIQALAAIIIAIVFALLEFQRVLNGAVALGQATDQAALIAFAVVTANVVHPIYALRELRGHQQLTVTQHTLHGYWDSFWNRIIGSPSTTDVGLYHNPTLHIAATVITWSTILLAVYDILGPFLLHVAKNDSSDPLIISGMKLFMGAGLSVAGVFFLQAAAHEIGVRILTDQPARLTDVLNAKQAERAAQEADILRQWEARRAEYDGRVADTRQNVRRRFTQNKLAERARREQKEAQGFPFMTPIPQPNGNGSHNGNGHTRP